MKLEQIKKRYSVKKFDPQRRVEDEKIEIIKQAFYNSPSSINIQAWKLFVVSDKKIKLQLAEAGKDTNHNRIKECSHLLIFTRKKVDFKHVKKVVESTEIFQILIKKRGLTSRKLTWAFWFIAKVLGGKNWLNYQIYLALGFIMATCAALDVGSLPMEGIKRSMMDKVLGIGSEHKTVVALAIGYPHEDDKENPSLIKKSRLPYEDMVQEI